MPPRRIYEHSGPAELVLEGENLTPDTLKLYHNGVLYTPLESSDTYAYYLLGDNGTNKVMLNGKNYSTIIVKDVVVPSILPCRMVASQANIENPNLGINQKVLEMGTCINYPYKKNEDYPLFRLSNTGEGWGNILDTDLKGYNCQVTTSAGAVSDQTRIACQVTDASKPAYITYQGFIIAVFNYSA